MRRFLLLIVLCISVSCLANTIHWITFIDTTDPIFGEYDINARDYMQTQWINKVNVALLDKGYQNARYDFYGESNTLDICKQTILDFKCDSNDIVVFYYIGHGGRANNYKSKYPQLLFTQQDESQCLPMEWVHEQLQAKNVRLTICIGMCCNSFDPSLKSKETLAFFPNNSIAEYNVNEMEAIQNMFLCNVGDIIASSSSIGQPSYVFEIPGMEHTMDVFTYRLIRNFDTYIKESSTPSWPTLFGRVTSDVSNLVLTKLNLSQTPQCEINLIKVSQPLPIPVLNPMLEQILDDITNPSYALMERRQMATDLKLKFTKNAIVKILGEDTNIVVDRMPISDYLDILFTSKLYKKIIVAAVKSDENDLLYTEMRVREYIIR